MGDQLLTSSGIIQSFPVHVCVCVCVFQFSFASKMYPINHPKPQSLKMMIVSCKSMGWLGCSADLDWVRVILTLLACESAVSWQAGWGLLI